MNKRRITVEFICTQEQWNEIRNKIVNSYLPCTVIGNTPINDVNVSFNETEDNNGKI